jgi:hypothetical protein
MLYEEANAWCRGHEAGLRWKQNTDINAWDSETMYQAFASWEYTVIPQNGKGRGASLETVSMNVPISLP